QLVELDAVAEDRDDCPRGRRRLVAEELRVAGPGLNGLEQRRELSVAGEVRFLARAAPLALLGKGHLEARSIDRDAVFRGELDRQVDRETERVVQPERQIAG